MWAIASIVTIGLTPEAVGADPYPAALKRVARGEKPFYHAGSGG